MRPRVRDRRRLLPYICRRDLKIKYEADKYGWGLDEKDLNDQQRQACVSASATASASLPYIRRRDKRNASYNEKYGYGQNPEEVTKQQQEACVAASATVDALSRYICRRCERNEARRKFYTSFFLSLMSDDERQECDDRAHDESAAPRNPPAGTTPPILENTNL